MSLCDECLDGVDGSPGVNCSGSCKHPSAPKPAKDFMELSARVWHSCRADKHGQLIDTKKAAALIQSSFEAIADKVIEWAYKNEHIIKELDTDDREVNELREIILAHESPKEEA